MKALPSLFLAVAALAWVTPCLHAQEFPFLARMTLQQQDLSRYKNGVYTDKVKTLRLTSNDLLDLVADAHGKILPFGARLVLVNYEFFQVQAANGTIVVTNTAPFLTYSDTYADDDFLYQGKEDTIKGSQKYTYFYGFRIRFNDPANQVSFTFNGTTLEKYSRSVADAFGHRVYKGSVALTGSGHGRMGNDFFLLSGRITSPPMTWFD